MKIADLHMHTNKSDGIYEPEEVIQFAKAAGLKTIAITDHDTFYHLGEVSALCEKYEVNLINGVEMSCYNYTNFKKIHIIGLNLPMDAPHVKALCDQVLQGRNDYHKELIENMNALGYAITFEDAKKFSHSHTVFKMHIFQAIQEKYPEVDEAFYDKHFRIKPTIEVEKRMNYIDIKIGIQAILQDGGVPILAHPNIYDSFPEVEEYISYGLKGIEVNHPRMKDEDKEKAKAIAKKHDLICSGGSDFHKKKCLANGAPEMGNCGLTQDEFDTLYQRVFNK